MTTDLTEEARTRDIDRMLGSLVEPAVAGLAAQLRSLGTLGEGEREAVRDGAATAVRDAVWQRVDRVVVLELNAARITGKLTAADSRARWEEWVAGLEQPGAWESLATPYPPLLPRVRRLVDNRCAAALTLARRFGRDRADLPALLGTASGELSEVSFGAGDSHQGGHTVSLLRCDPDRLVVYKPRPLESDAALAALLPRLLPGEPEQSRIRVPVVLTRCDHQGGYGWAAHVKHQYCASDDELHCFYRGLGHWLAVMRLLGGSDLHFQNLVAAGPVPVVVDCETLFTPHRAAEASGYGAAVDLAADRVRQSVLRTGLLPGRGATLGWRGADWSAAGRLAGEQPAVEVAMIADLGTDQARLTTAYGVPSPGPNHPSLEPDLSAYWPVVIDAFTELNAELSERDRAGELAPLLAGFADCPVRVVLRDTASYATLERMLWHPKALHEPEVAIARATDLLVRQARNLTGAPDQPAVIDAEITDLLAGDVPTFVTTPASGVLTGPGGVRWGEPEDLIAAALANWRVAAPAVDRQVVQAALVGAYLNVELAARRRRVAVTRIRDGDLDRRRRAQAAAVLRRLSATAIRGGDGTVTWVAPGLNVTGWAVRPLGPELYDGGAGVAVLLAAYQREVAHGRAEVVPGLATLLTEAVATLERADDQQERDRAQATEARIRVRPGPAGGYLGLGSRIWGWLLLHDLGAVGAAEAIRRAEALAALLPEAVEADESWDLLSGAAGAVVPLLRLSERTGAGRWRELAREIGHRLREFSAHSGDGAYWPSRAYPEGIGGLSHGVTGFGWALARLATATGEVAFGDLAAAAFAREETYYDPRREGWLDARLPEGIAVAWCHGSVGIGAVAADLLANHPDRRTEYLRDLLHRAARATWPDGLGSTHTLCHGDMSAWEVLDRAWAAGLGPSGVDRDRVVAQILTSLEDHGPAAGLTRDVFTPALMSGLGGVAYQLLRMHPESRLPSVLLPDPGPAG
jgi:type 2 lantibiotic biosynthesis protein LanM